MNRNLPSFYAGAAVLAYEAQVVLAAGDRETAMARFEAAWRAARQSSSVYAPDLIARIERDIRANGGTVPYVFVGALHDHPEQFPKCAGRHCGGVLLDNADATMCEFCEDIRASAAMSARNEANVTDGRSL